MPDQLQLVAALLEVEGHVTLARAHLIQGDVQAAATPLLHASSQLQDLCDDLAAAGWTIDHFHKEDKPMKEPLKMTYTLTDGEGDVKSTYTLENLDQATVVLLQTEVSDRLNALAAKIVAGKKKK